MRTSLCLPYTRARSGSNKAAPFSESGSAAQFEILSLVTGAVLVEMVENGGVDSGEFQRRLHASESQHRTLASPEWQVGTEGPRSEFSARLFAQQRVSWRSRMLR